MARRGATTRDPKVKMERLSPGVYRSAQGGLVTQQGRPIQRQPKAPMQPAPPQSSGMQMDPGYFNAGAGRDIQDIVGLVGQVGQQMPMDKMYRWPQDSQMPQMPQPSANMGGQYRLSPGVYGTQQQAMNQYNKQMQQMYQSATPGAVNAPEQMPDFARFGPIVLQNRRG